MKKTLLIIFFSILVLILAYLYILTLLPKSHETTFTQTANIPEYTFFTPEPLQEINPLRKETRTEKILKKVPVPKKERKKITEIITEKTPKGEKIIFYRKGKTLHSTAPEKYHIYRIVRPYGRELFFTAGAVYYNRKIRPSLHLWFYHYYQVHLGVSYVYPQDVGLSLGIDYKRHLFFTITACQHGLALGVALR